MLGTITTADAVLSGRMKEGIASKKKRKLKSLLKSDGAGGPGVKFSGYGKKPSIKADKALGFSDILSKISTMKTKGRKISIPSATSLVKKLTIKKSSVPKVKLKKMKKNKLIKLKKVVKIK